MRRCATPGTPSSGARLSAFLWGVRQVPLLTTPPLHGGLSSAAWPASGSPRTPLPNVAASSSSCPLVGCGDLTVRPLARLPADQQRHLLQLRSLLARSTQLARSGSGSGDEVLPRTQRRDARQPRQRRRQTIHVACRVECEESEASLPLTLSVPPFFTGVNHALHTCVNGAHRGDGDGLLKGILKGCAEQNALGALAAGGAPYTAVSRVYLASSPVHGRSEAPLPRSCACDSADRQEPRVGAGEVLFPCPECWHHLTRVGRMRAARGLPTVELLVWAGSAREAAAAAAAAARRLSEERDGGLTKVAFVFAA